MSNAVSMVSVAVLVPKITCAADNFSGVRRNVLGLVPRATGVFLRSTGHATAPLQNSGVSICTLVGYVHTLVGRKSRRQMRSRAACASHLG